MGAIQNPFYIVKGMITTVKEKLPDKSDIKVKIKYVGWLCLPGRSQTIATQKNWIYLHRFFSTTPGIGEDGELCFRYLEREPSQMFQCLSICEKVARITFICEGKEPLIFKNNEGEFSELAHKRTYLKT